MGEFSPFKALEVDGQAWLADLPSILVSPQAAAVRLCQFGARSERACGPLTDRCRIDLVSFQAQGVVTTALNLNLRISLLGSVGLQVAAGAMGPPYLNGMLFTTAGVPGTLWELWGNVTPGAAAVPVFLDLRAVCDHCCVEPYTRLGILK